MDLIPAGPLAWLARVLGFGADKYSENNWKELSSPKDLARIKAALFRHVVKLVDGEWSDEESGLPHAAHAMCNLVFLLWHHDKMRGIDPFTVDIDTLSNPCVESSERKIKRKL